MGSERDTRSARRTRGGAATQRTADEWWESLVLERPATGGAAAVQALPAGGTRGRRSERAGAARVLRGASVLAAVGAAIGDRMAANQRFRRAVIGLVVLVVLLTGTLLSVGVIVLNNQVIERSAELGRLDHTRRDLRTDNALISAEIARLSAPPRIVALARRRLGMEPSPTMTRYIYLDDRDRPKPPQRIDVDIARGMRAIAIIAAHQELPAAYRQPSAPAPAAPSATASKLTAGELAGTDPAIGGSAGSEQSP
jgi:hypothetical protein